MTVERQSIGRVHALPRDKAQRAIPQMVRMTAWMLLTDLVTDVAQAIVLESGKQNAQVELSLLLALPTLGLLTGVLLQLSKGATVYTRTLNWLLIFIMITDAAQLIITPFAMQAIEAPQNATVSGADIRSMRGLTHSYAGLQTAIVFMMIPAVLGAWISGRHRAWRWALLGVALSTLAVLMLDGNDQSFAELLPFVAEETALVLLALFVGSLADQERRVQEQLQSANLLLAEQSQIREQLATSRERLRVARELHDTVAHSMAGLVFQLDALDTLIGDGPESVRQMLARAKQVARQGLVDARTAVTGLRASAVGDLGLLKALQQQVNAGNSEGRVPIVFDHVNGPKPVIEMLSETSSDALFRIAQEAMSNAAQHAHASRICVKLIEECMPAAERAQVTLRVEDDGVGFDVSAMESGHYGLRGIRERAALVGAQLQLNSVIGVGTTLSVQIPVEL
jgi:signal transduction histidine kinase